MSSSRTLHGASSQKPQTPIPVCLQTPPPLPPLPKILIDCCLAYADWAETVTVEAWVVTICNATAADKVGLLFPLLQRYQAGKCSMMVFGLPAVQVRAEAESGLQATNN